MMNSVIWLSWCMVFQCSIQIAECAGVWKESEDSILFHHMNSEQHTLPSAKHHLRTLNMVKTTATYDPAYGAPRCTGVSSYCNTGTLLVGVGNNQSGGPESHSPNTIDDCVDVTSGIYQQDESVDKIAVRSQDGFALSSGEVATIEVTVFTATNTSRRAIPSGFEVAHFYYATNVSYAPVEWNYLETRYVMPMTGSQTLKCSYTLPEGDTQAVRVNYGYNEFIKGPCTGLGGYSDVDDVVFAVAPALTPPTSSPTITPSRAIVDPFSQMAVYDSGHYNALRCFSVGSSCDTGIELSYNIAPNRTNSLYTVDNCSVESVDAHIRNESVMRLKVISVDGQNMTVGSKVRIIATVATSKNTTERDPPDQMNVAHFFSSTNTFPGWRYLKTVFIPSNDRSTTDVHCDFILTEGDTQVIRVNYGYHELTIGSCISTNHFSDIIDLVFAVDQAAVFPSPTPSQDGDDEYKENHILAVYDASFGGPKCDSIGSSCDTGTELISGVSGLESHPPNTIDDCDEQPRTAGQSSESIDRILIKSMNSLVMKPGTVVNIQATVTTASNTTDRENPYEYEVAHFYHTANASLSPEWEYITTVFVTPRVGSKTISCEFTLPEGELQAVRVNFGYEEYTIGSCTNNGIYTDIDDLVFSVYSSSDEPLLLPSATEKTFSPSESFMPTVSNMPSSSPSISSMPSISSLPSFMPSEEPYERTWWDDWWPFPPHSSTSVQTISRWPVIFLSLILFCI